MKKFRFLDPVMIMGVVVVLIILVVGVFAFFVTIQAVTETIDETNEEKNQQIENTIDNISKTGNDVFSIVGVVLIFGAVAAVVGVVYSFTRGMGDEPSSSSSSYPLTPTPTYDRQVRQRREEAKERDKQRKIEAKKKTVERKKKQAELKEKNAYNKGRPSRTSKAARMLDEREGTKKRRKST